MELAIAALVVIYIAAKLEHYQDSKRWAAERSALLNRIQAPEQQIVKEFGDEEGAVSFIGDESDTRGLTGDPFADE